MSIKAVSAEKALSPNDRVLRIAVAVLTLPWTLARLTYRGVKRLARARKSPRELRDEDQLRQSRARRTLRGLAADHDQESRSSR